MRKTTSSGKSSLFLLHQGTSPFQAPMSTARIPTSPSSCPFACTPAGPLGMCHCNRPSRNSTLFQLSCKHDHSNSGIRTASPHAAHLAWNTDGRLAPDLNAKRTCPQLKRCPTHHARTSALPHHQPQHVSLHFSTHKQTSRQTSRQCPSGFGTVSEWLKQFSLYILIVSPCGAQAQRGKLGVLLGRAGCWLCYRTDPTSNTVSVTAALPPRDRM